MTARVHGNWTHHAACPGAPPDAWWAQTPVVWVFRGEVVEQWRCVACGSHVARASLFPVVLPREARA